MREDLDRLEMNARLLQTFIAEQMLKSHGCRKTVSFGTRQRGSLVEVFTSSMTLKQMLSMRPNEIFVSLAKEIEKSLYETNLKFIAVLSFTAYREDATADEIKNGLNKVGYCALGNRVF